MSVETPLELCRSSERLLEHYKKKTDQWKDRVVELMGLVEDCKVLCSQYADAEVELQKREVEVSKLKVELGDVKRGLFDEKQRVMRLVDDKDKLRLELLESKRTFKMVLDMLGLKECQVASFFQQPPHGSIKDGIKSGRIRRGVKKIIELGIDPVLKESKLKEDLQSVNLRVRLLESQLEEQHCLFNEEIENLLEERRTLVRDREDERKILQHRISCLNCRLEGTRVKICDKIKEKVEEQSKKMESDIKLMLENEKLMRCLVICKELLGEEFPSDLDSGRPRRLKSEITQLQAHLSEKMMAISTLQTQTNLLRAQINKMQEEFDEANERNIKEKEILLQKQDFSNKRFEKEHKRRVLEAAGFRSDIKLMRTSLQSLERQIRYKEIRAKCEEGDKEPDQPDICQKKKG